MKMKSTNSTLLAGTIFGLLLTFTNVAFATSLSLTPGQYVPGEVLVKFKPTVSAQSGMATVSAMGGAVQSHLNRNVMNVKLGTGKTVETSIAEFRNNPNVEYAQPNYIYHATATPIGTSEYAQQWAFKNINQTVGSPTSYTQPAGGTLFYTASNPPGAAAIGKDMNIEPAWGIITDCSSVIVAVVDSGVNYNHQDLSANMWAGTALHGQNFASDMPTGAGSDPMDRMGHGTHVAGIIGAGTSAGTGGNVVTGVCWKAKIMAVRVLDATGTGNSADIWAGIDYAVANGAKVINMSLGGSNFDQLYSDAITRAQTADVVVVAAAGNENSNNDTTPSYPCNFTQSNIICVAALDQAYGLATFSNIGATSVDVGAPGTNILSTWAGATTIDTSETLASGWTMTGGGTGGTGWAYGYDTPNALNVLYDPNYTANANHHIFKPFNLNGLRGASVDFYLAGIVTTGDSLGIGMSPTGTDPFTATGATTLDGGAFNIANYTKFSIPVSVCNTTACTLGFSLTSKAASSGAGPVVASFSITKLDTSNNNYNTENGTSMATPAVAGLATMLRAYNSSYTYSDVVNSIKNAGTATASLSGKTTTGKAVNVMSSLAYINTPTGLAATVQ